MSELLLIEKETVEAIADKTRGLAGLSENRKLSTANIIYWLGRLKPLDIAWAISDNSITLSETKASGFAIPIQKERVETEISLSLTTKAY